MEVISLGFQLFLGFSFNNTWRILTLSLPELSVELHDEPQVQVNSSWPWIDLADLTAAELVITAQNNNIKETYNKAHLKL